MKRQILVLLLLIWMPIAGLTADQQVVTIDVAGLACPFCVYSLEKSLTKLENIESIEVDLAGAFARIVIREGRQADLDAIRQAIVNAGFAPGDATTSSGG
jgi:copper chaperone CopZ